jgi:hypothetical protein
LASGITRFEGPGGGELGQGLLQLLELCRHDQFVSCLTTLPIAVESSLDIFTDGDDATWP